MGIQVNHIQVCKLEYVLVIQHLKAYSSDKPLNQSCVDNRFQYVKRNSAKYVEHLGIKENPIGAGWAAGKDYGKKKKY